MTSGGALGWMAKNGVAANVLMLVLIVGGLVTLVCGVLLYSSLRRKTA